MHCNLNCILHAQQQNLRSVGLFSLGTWFSKNGSRNGLHKSRPQVRLLTFLYKNPASKQTEPTEKVLWYSTDWICSTIWRYVGLSVSILRAICCIILLNPTKVIVFKDKDNHEFLRWAISCSKRYCLTKLKDKSLLSEREKTDIFLHALQLKLYRKIGWTIFVRSLIF